jgi:hypothetical protein
MALADVTVTDDVTVTMLSRPAERCCAEITSLSQGDAP